MPSSLSSLPLVLWTPSTSSRCHRNILTERYPGYLPTQEQNKSSPLALYGIVYRKQCCNLGDGVSPLYHPWWGMGRCEVWRRCPTRSRILLRCQRGRYALVGLFLAWDRWVPWVSLSTDLLIDRTLPCWFYWRGHKDWASLLLFWMGIREHRVHMPHTLMTIHLIYNHTLIHSVPQETCREVYQPWSGSQMFRMRTTSQVLGHLSWACRLMW